MQKVIKQLSLPADQTFALALKATREKQSQAQVINELLRCGLAIQRQTPFL